MGARVKLETRKWSVEEPRMCTSQPLVSSLPCFFASSSFSRVPPLPRLMACFVLVLLLGRMLTPAAAQDAFMTKAGHAEFTSRVPLHTFTGTSDHLVGKINLADSTVDFYLDLATLETGIGKRDKDMRETLEVDEYPFAEFFGTLVSPFDPTRRAPQPATVRGEFTLHGVSRTVTIDGTLQRTADGLKVEAAWEINLNDYNIEPPSLLIVRVDEVQKVRIDALLTPVDESAASSQSGQ